MNLRASAGIRCSNAPQEGTIRSATDRATIDRARHGDPAAFEEIVSARMDAVYRLSYAILGNEADARDAAQETFVTAWRQIGKLRDPDRFDAWLQRVAVNASRMTHRARRRRGVREIAVRGWYSANPPTPCMIRLGPIVIDPLQTTCDDEYVWLLEDPERLPLVDADAAVAPQPAGPGFHPYLGRLSRSWAANPITSGQGVLLDVVMVGHFDDTEATTCPKSSREACRDRFVVDQVWSGDRADLLSSTTEP